MKINSDFRKIAVMAAKDAGEIIKKHFGKKNHKISFKNDLSLVTNIDVMAERKIIKLIKSKFPSHEILAEEEGGRIGEKYTWVIDPLDGTTNYIINLPFFSISIALLYRKKPVLGIVLNPITSDIYFAEKGKGAYLNGRRIKMKKKKESPTGIFLLNKGRSKKDFIELYKNLKKIGNHFRTFRVLGSASLMLCLIASGGVDGCLNIGGNCWDLLAGILIIKEAGGRVTNLKGENWQIEMKDIIASNKRNHNQLLKLFRSK